MPGCDRTRVREIIHQGPLKLKDSSKSIDAHGIIFTDMLLIVKERRNKKYKIIKPPIPTNRIEIRETKDDKAIVIIQHNIYNVPEAVYMLITNPQKNWVEKLNKAKVSCFYVFHD